MRRSIYGIAIIVALSVSTARASDDVNMNKMIAASAVLEDTMLLRGHRVIDSGDKAHYDSIVSGEPGETVVFEKQGECVYSVIMSLPKNGRHYSIIDFSKLDGSYNSYGETMTFRGGSRASG